MLYPPMAITGRTRLAGLVGWPIAQSRSPALHNHWLARYSIDGAYVPLPVPPGGLPAALAGLAAAGFAGVNVTYPHKEDAAALCQHLSPMAQRCGAVNTIVFGPDGAVGDITDGTGFVAALRGYGAVPGHAIIGHAIMSSAIMGPAMILGAGGAAAAIAAALLDAGIAVTIAARTAHRADALAARLPGLMTCPWADRLALGPIRLLINATPLGMVGQPPLDMPLDTAPPGLMVAEIVLAPRITPLLAAATARGLATADGLGMLVNQAVPGFAAWFGTIPAADDAAFAAADLMATDGVAADVMAADVMAAGG